MMGRIIEEPDLFDVDGNITAASYSAEAPHPQIQNVDDQDKEGKKADEAAGFKRKDSPILVAAKMGILEMVKKIHKKCPIAIRDLDSQGKNVVMVAVEHRHTAIFHYLFKEAALPEYMFRQFDDQGNNILHLAAKLTELYPWRIPGAALQMQWEIKWYKHVKSSLSGKSIISHPNRDGKTPRALFTETHKGLIEAGNQRLIRTSESCSLVAALIATVAFATSATVPGGLNQDHGYPVLQNEEPFDVFAIASLVALSLSITALIFFLAIVTSRCEERIQEKSAEKADDGAQLSVRLHCCHSLVFLFRAQFHLENGPQGCCHLDICMYYHTHHLFCHLDICMYYKKVPLRSYRVFSY